MRLIEALGLMVFKADVERRQRPVVTMDRYSLITLAKSIEEDLGARHMYMTPHKGFEFYGIRFRPNDKPRLRVKALTQQVSG